MITPTTKCFAKLSSNLHSYVLQFITVKEAVYFSQLNKAFRTALSNDYIWEHFAKEQELFLPDESESFTSWKQYFDYLSKLSANLKNDSNKKTFKMKPYRGHKAVITTVLPVQMHNAPFAVIVSGDTDGKVLTWYKDEYEDEYTSETLVEADSAIHHVKLVNDNRMIVWTKENAYYVYEVNTCWNNGVDSECTSALPRFTLLCKFVVDVSNNAQCTMHYTTLSKDSSTLYACVDILCKDEVKETPFIYVYDNICDYNNMKRSKLQLTHSYEMKQKIRNVQLSSQQSNNVIQVGVVNVLESPFVLLSQYQLISFLNFDSCGYTPLSCYYRSNTNNKFDNVIIFNTRYLTSKTFYIDMSFILNVYLLPSNDNNRIAFIGYNHNEEIRVCICNLKDNNALNTIASVDLIFTSDTKYQKYLKVIHIDTEVIVVTNGEEIITVDTKANKVDGERSVKLDGINKRDINVVNGDKHRVIIGTANNLLKIYSVKSGKVWYNLKGGSFTVVPKSFVAHPMYKWFHLVCLTRFSVIGVLGNLIREYSFKPGV